MPIAKVEGDTVLVIPKWFLRLLTVILICVLPWGAWVSKKILLIEAELYMEPKTRAALNEHLHEHDTEVRLLKQAISIHLAAHKASAAP